MLSVCYNLLETKPARFICFMDAVYAACWSHKGTELFLSSNQNQLKQDIGNGSAGQMIEHLVIYKMVQLMAK